MDKKRKPLKQNSNYIFMKSTKYFATSGFVFFYYEIQKSMHHFVFSLKVY